MIVNLRYEPDAQARKSPKAAAHPSLARRASMSSLLAFRKVTIKAARLHADAGFLANLQNAKAEVKNLCSR